MDQRVPPRAGSTGVWFTAADGTRLHGWYFPGTVGPETVTIVYFHGNGGNITNLGWIGEYFSERGFRILLFNYRGYEGEIV